MAIVDLSLPGLGGLNLIQRISAEYLTVKVLVLSSHPEEQYAFRAFKAGASGFITKDMAAAELVAAVRKVAAGGTHVSVTMAERVMQQISARAAATAHGKALGPGA